MKFNRKTFFLFYNIRFNKYHKNFIHYYLEKNYYITDYTSTRIQINFTNFNRILIAELI